MITVDLHSHILPGIDDGSPDEETSVRMLREEASQGICKIVLSPHFHLGKDSADEFVQRRKSSFIRLQKALEKNFPENEFDLRPGAEIRYNPFISDFERLDDLCIAGTKVLLIEFSHRNFPEFVEDVFYHLQLKGYIPLIAHAERYPWLRKSPDKLYELVRNGAYAQFNAEDIVENRSQLRFVKSMIENGLLHGIGSDTHNMDKRPPLIASAEKKIREVMGKKIIEDLNAFSDSLLGGYQPEVKNPIRPKTGFFRFFT